MATDQDEETRTTRSNAAAEGRRVTNAEIKRGLQRIEGRILKQDRTMEKLEPILPDLARLAASTDTLLGLAKEHDDKTVTWTVLKQWTRWDNGTRTFVKMVAGALIVAICTIVVYTLFHLTPLGGETTPHPTPTPITTPITIPVVP